MAPKYCQMFLRRKKLIVRYKGAVSEAKNMPGGGPEGTNFNIFLFLVMIIDAGFLNQIREMGVRITSAINKRIEIDTKQ